MILTWRNTSAFGWRDTDDFVWQDATSVAAITGFMQIVLDQLKPGMSFTQLKPSIRFSSLYPDITFGVRP